MGGWGGDTKGDCGMCGEGYGGGGMGCVERVGVVVVVVVVGGGGGGYEVCGDLFVVVFEGIIMGEGGELWNMWRGILTPSMY